MLLEERRPGLKSLTTLNFVEQGEELIRPLLEALQRPVQFR